MIKRIIPNLNVTNATAGHEFYVEFLGSSTGISAGRPLSKPTTT
jgi:hypothetical protein